MAEETTHKVTRALFPGSFDPFTAGHLNILKRAISSDKISITLEDGILHAAMEQFHARSTFRVSVALLSSAFTAD